jgi:hypothetical protein
MDDSFRIAELLYGSPPPQPLPMTIGYLEIVGNLPLAIDAVYTVTDREGRAVAIEVERAEGRPKERAEGRGNPAQAPGCHASRPGSRRHP